MPERLVFGEADPAKYIEPLCHCGHECKDHHGEGPHKDEAPCWHGWTNMDAGCNCDRWLPDERTRHGD